MWVKLAYSTGAGKPERPQNLPVLEIGPIIRGSKGTAALTCGSFVQQHALVLPRRGQVHAIRREPHDVHIVVGMICERGQLLGDLII